MTTLCSLFLLSLRALMRLDILIWVLAIPVLIVASVILYYQRRRYLRLSVEVNHLAKIKRHTIEYDLVLKAMKLCVWRIDVPTQTLTFESDYRDASDDMMISQGSILDVIYKRLAPHSLGAFKTALEDLMAGRSDEFHQQYQVRDRQENRMYWGESFAIVDRHDIEGKPLSIVGTSMRIDHQKEIEQALIEARNKAEESDRLKSAFLANISHEIRTPLNAIVGFSEVLASENGSDEHGQLVELIRQNNTRLLRLFEDMVNMSKLEAGDDSVKKTRFPLNRLLADVAERFTQEADRRGLKLLVEGLSDDLTLHTDRDRLREILNQYVDNALKFTDEGTVTIGSDLRDGKLRMWVRDTGKGIPADRCDERLFERFVKVDEFIPGTGLGLSICRSLAISLGGTVGVESKEGEGSLFWVEIVNG